MKTTVKGSRAVYEEITIDTDETYRIARESILNACDFKKFGNWYKIVDGKLVAFIDHGGHGSGYVEEVPVREATELDKAAVLVLDALSQWKRNF